MNKSAIAPNCKKKEGDWKEIGVVATEIKSNTTDVLKSTASKSPKAASLRESASLSGATSCPDASAPGRSFCGPHSR